MRVVMLDVGLPRGSAFGDLLGDALSQRSIELDRVSNQLQLEAAMDHAATDGILLVDIAATSNNAPMLLRMLREKRESVAVIVLAGVGSDTVPCATWLDANVDDCLAWPIDAVEAAARVAAAIRRASRAHQPRKQRHGNLVLDVSKASVEWRGNAIALTPREAVVLEVLMAHAGCVVSRETLHAALHGDDDVRGNTVEVYVHGLRRKLQPGLIRTIRGAGYRLTEAARVDP